MKTYIPAIPDTLPAPFARRLISWQYHLQGGGVTSARTVGTYLEGLILFGEWLHQEGHSGQIEAITPDQIRRFLTWLRDKKHYRTGQPLSASTVNNRGRALQAFFKWVALEYEMVDPMAKVEIPKPAEVLIPVLEDDDLRLLLEVCKGKTFQERRDFAFIKLLIDTGMRLSEAANLRLPDLDLKMRKATVLGKGGRQRECLFGAKAVTALDKYLEARETHTFCHVAALWLGMRGPLTVSGCYQIINDRGLDAALRSRDPAQQERLRTAHPHSFRHTAAHRYLSAGGQQENLNAHMGWQSPTMVARYAAATKKRRAEEEYRRLGIGDDI